MSYHILAEIDLNPVINSPSWRPSCGSNNFSTWVAKYTISSIRNSGIVFAVKLNHRPTSCTLFWCERRRIVPLILGKIAVRSPLSNITLEVRKTLTTFVTLLPLTGLVGMFTVMISANSVTLVIARTADSWEGIYFILVVIIAHRTITAFCKSEWTLFAAKTAVRAYWRVNVVLWRGNKKGGETARRATELRALWEGELLGSGGFSVWKILQSPLCFFHP